MRILLEDVLKMFYAKEINIDLHSFWDGGWFVKIGDHMNGYKHEAGRLTLDEVTDWLNKKYREMTEGVEP